MKKNLCLLFLLTALFSSSLPAQTSSPLKLGIRVAPGIDWINMETDGYESDGIRGGFSAGVISDFYFAKNYALSTGFSFNFLNGKETFRDWNDDSSVPFPGTFERKYNFIYLEIPVMLKMKTRAYGKYSFYAQVGVGTGFRMKSTVKDHFTSDTGTESDREDNYNSGTTLIRESVLVGIGSEYSLDESSRILLGLNYSNALNNIFTGSNELADQKLKGLLNFLELNIAFLF